MQPEQVKAEDWGFLSSHLCVFSYTREADERRENRGRLQSMSNGYSGPGNKSLDFSLKLIILYRNAGSRRFRLAPCPCPQRRQLEELQSFESFTSKRISNLTDALNLLVQDA